MAGLAYLLPLLFVPCLATDRTLVILLLPPAGPAPLKPPRSSLSCRVYFLSIRLSTLLFFFSFGFFFAGLSISRLFCPAYLYHKLLVPGAVYITLLGFDRIGSRACVLHLELLDILLFLVALTYFVRASLYLSARCFAFAWASARLRCYTCTCLNSCAALL